MEPLFRVAVFGSEVVVGFVDLLGFLIGQISEFGGEVLDFVGVIFGDLLAVKTFDFRRSGRLVEFEDFRVILFLVQIGRGVRGLLRPGIFLVPGFQPDVKPRQGQDEDGEKEISSHFSSEAEPQIGERAWRGGISSVDMKCWTRAASLKKSLLWGVISGGQKAV
jgi:hypothetical protein